MRIVAGEARGRTIQAPPGDYTRPTLDRVRENLFNMLQAHTPGSRVLDLFAGSGALSLEALSRGADYAVLVDRDRAASSVQRKNIESLGYREKTRVLLCDWRQALRKLGEEGNRFDLVLLDPPYALEDQELREVFAGLVPLLLPEALVVLEHASGRSFDPGAAFLAERERAWGYCGVTFYTLSDKDAQP